MKTQNITINNAREHNLKNINLKIPRKALTVITGISGSGKSSLAFDTIYAEGHRRYVESLSAYARQFIDILKKPEVENIDGLSPSIAINQKVIFYSPRSTVGTITDIYDFLRLLYAKVATPYCYKCGKKINSQKINEMTTEYYSLPEGTKLQIFAPIVRGRKGEHSTLLNKYRQEGYTRVVIDGENHSLDDEITLNKNKTHDIDLCVDRIIVNKGVKLRLSDSISLATKLSDGVVKIQEGKKKPVLISEKFTCIDCGISYPNIEPRFFSFNSPYGACKKCSGLGKINEGEKICPDCNGTRLSIEARSIKINDKAITDLSLLQITDLNLFLKELSFTGKEKLIADKVIKEITERLDFIVDVGLGYMTLSRNAATLSGGESQRIRLATQLGAGLTGVLYVLDEPSIGLHPRDNRKLINTLVRLKDKGNTVLVVEHDEDTILAADHIIDLGPGAGIHGGHIVAEGNISAILGNNMSLTGKYLSLMEKIHIPKKRKASTNKYISIKNATTNNLKNVDVDIPIGLLTCVTGVSGSGKSSLIIDTLYPSICNVLNDEKKFIGCKKITGADIFEKVIDIDQSPIGRTPRSNPATYTGFFSYIRNLFSRVPEARSRGYSSGRFSFNVNGGRCEACEGQGLLKIEMNFMPDVFVMCDTCRGSKYSRETLEIRYKGKNISEVLEMTVEEAMSFFKNVKPIYIRLKTLYEVGLGYIKIGQPATTLSGGEAQRIKLSRELVKRSTGKTIYILDEPTTGLHFDDIKKLLDVIHRLRDQNNTIIIIEHNLEVIKTADYIIDIGPEGGEKGGYVTAIGSPEELAQNPNSCTGQYLKEKLGGSNA